MKKKLLSLLLCAVMMLSVFTGCVSSGASETAPEDKSVLKVGYGRVDVTPTESVPLAGLGSKRYSRQVDDQLYVTCIAFADETGNTVLMYHMDILNTYDIVYGWRADIAAATNVPLDNIILSATHNHSGPSMSSDEVPYMDTYRTMFKQALIDSAQTAIADLKVATMYTTSCVAENLAFVRHYLRTDGTYNGHGGSSSEAERGEYVGQAVKVDEQMQLIKFVREGGKDVLLMNWHGHPRAHSDTDESYTGTYKKNRVLSDVDVIRKEIEAQMDCQFAFFLGASGNVNSCGVIPSEVITYEYIAHNKVVAERAIAAAANFEQAESGKVQILTQTVKATRHNGEDVTVAGVVNDVPATVFAIGEVAFVIAGYEMFTESGQDIKAASPFKTTFIVTCANGDHKYMPSLPTFSYIPFSTPVYETRTTSTRFIPGTAELFVDTYKAMLQQLKAE